MMNPGTPKTMNMNSQTISTPAAGVTSRHETQSPDALSNQEKNGTRVGMPSRDGRAAPFDLGTRAAVIDRAAAQAHVLARAGMHDLSVRSAQVLCELAACPAEALKMGVIARKLELSTAGVTGLIDALEKRGLVARQTTPHDRRVILIHLTEKGYKATADMLLV